MISEFGGDFIQWLRGFYYVATSGSVSAAAVLMLRNQPAVSHQIKALEDELGVTLYDRSKGKMTLTAEGSELLEYTISLFEVIKEMRSEIGRKDRDVSGKISIATTHAINVYYLPGYIIPFQQKHRGVFFDVKGGPLTSIMECVDSSEADFAITNFVDVPGSVSYEELFRTRLVLVGPKQDIFEIGEKVTIEKLRTLPLLAPPKSSTIYTQIQNLAKDYDFHWNISQTLNSFSLVKRYAQLGMGVTILDEYTMLEDSERLSTYSLDAFLPPRSYGIAVRKRKYLSPQVRSFIHCLKDRAPDFDIRQRVA